MQACRSKWAPFSPKSKVYWLQYLAEKIANAKTYQGKADKATLEKLRYFVKKGGQHGSAMAVLRAYPRPLGYSLLISMELRAHPMQALCDDVFADDILWEDDP